MALTNGPNLGLLVNGNAGEGHYTDLMKQWRGIDGLVMPNAKGYLTNTPPGSPSDGDLYIIGAAPTGAWAGQGGKVTRWSSVANAWEFYAPKNGWQIQSNSDREVYRYTGGAWEIFYQEGTWTPVLNGFTTSGSPILTGKYWRIAKHVTVYSSLDPDGGSIVSTGGTSNISGLPFTVAFGGAGQVGNNFAENYTSASIIVSGGLYPPSWVSNPEKIFYISGTYVSA